MKRDNQERKFVATVADYQKTFNTPHGKRVLRHLMKVHGFMNAVFVPDALAMSYNEGARNVVVQILQKIRMDLVSLENEIIEQRRTEGESDVII